MLLNRKLTGIHGLMRPLKKPAKKKNLYFSVQEPSGATGAMSWQRNVLKMKESQNS